MKQTAKVTAKGMWREKPIIMEVRRYGDGLDENDDWQTGTLEIVKDGKKFTLRDAWRASRHDEENDEDLSYVGRLVKCVRERYEKARHGYGYKANFKSIEAYWLAFNYGDGFDEVPEIEVEGKIDTFGSPFSDEDTSHVVF